MLFLFIYFLCFNKKYTKLKFVNNFPLRCIRILILVLLQKGHIIEYNLYFLSTASFFCVCLENKIFFAGLETLPYAFVPLITFSVVVARLQPA